jgi:hypothetical protein
MNELIIACVRTGDIIPFDCVVTLRNAVARNLALPYTMVCLTDQPERCTGVSFVDISAMELRGRWGTMALFEPAWRDGSKVIYFGFDVAVIGDIAPLAGVPGEFAICQSTVPTRRYNSSVMVIGGGMGNFIWHAFERRRELLVVQHVQGGVASCLEQLYPSAPLLQRLLPPEFFKTQLRLMRPH